MFWGFDEMNESTCCLASSVGPPSDLVYWRKNKNLSTSTKHIVDKAVADVGDVVRREKSQQIAESSSVGRGVRVPAWVGGVGGDSWSRSPFSFPIARLCSRPSVLFANRTDFLKPSSPGQVQPAKFNKPSSPQRRSVPPGQSAPVGGPRRTSDMDLDSVLREVGQFGRYQMFVFFLLFFSIVYTTFFTLTFVFTASDLQYRWENEIGLLSNYHFNFYIT